MQENNMHQSEINPVTIRIQEIIGKKERTAVSKAIGVAYNTVSKWLNGQSVPELKQALAICEYKNVKLDWLLFGKGAKYADEKNKDAGATIEKTSSFGVQSRRVPIISWVQAGAWMQIENIYHPGEGGGDTALCDNVGSRSFALRVVGDSMAPLFQPGDLLVVDPDVAVESGDYVIAKIKNGSGENGEATFKQFIRDGNSVYLKPLNKEYKMMDMTDKEFHIVGCVVQKTMKFKN